MSVPLPPMRTVLPVLILSILVAGCDNIRTIDPGDRDHDPRLVLQERFQPGQPWMVSVSRSVGAFEPGEISDEQFSVTNATVSVFQGDKRLGVLSRDTLNRYSTDAFVPALGSSYTVRATAPGMDTVAATDRIPSLPPLRLSSTDTGTRYDELQLTIDDPGATANYYRIVLEETIEVDSGRTTRDRRRFRTQSRPVLNEMGESVEVDEENEYQGDEAVFTDGLFNGQSFTINLEVRRRRRPRGQSLTPTYWLQVQVLSEDTYRYLRTRRLGEDTEENPFSTPVDVEGNVEGGYGLVGGYNVDTLRQQVQRESASQEGLPE